MSGLPVLLTWPEVYAAATIGVLRHIGSCKRGDINQHGATEKDAWGMHLEGACGEMAFAKALGIYWPATVGTYRNGDDVPGFQVRTRRLHSWDLLIRPQDDDGKRYALVTGEAPSYRVHGWILAGDAKRPEWLQDYGGRPPAYFVPQAALTPLGTLALSAEVTYGY